MILNTSDNKMNFHEKYTLAIWLYSESSVQRQYPKKAFYDIMKSYTFLNIFLNGRIVLGNGKKSNESKKIPWTSNWSYSKSLVLRSQSKSCVLCHQENYTFKSDFSKKKRRMVLGKCLCKLPLRLIQNHQPRDPTASKKLCFV